MPDWTYQPLRRPAAAVLGPDRSRRAALRALATLSSRPAGRGLAASLSGASDRSPAVTARLGASVPVALAHDAVRALPPLGAGVIEIGPVGPGDVVELRRAAAGRRCVLVARVTSPEVAREVEPLVDRVVVGDDPASVRLDDPALDRAIEALAGGAVVLARPALLVEAGPGWFQRVNEAATVAPATGTGGPAGWDPRGWPAWWWGLLLGLGMITGGLVAAAITLGPLLLWYDDDYLGEGRDGLEMLNHHLGHFLQHDRITLAGTMVTIGILYSGLAAGGIRRGWAWARDALLASGAVGFPTLFYFFGSGFLEPLHIAATAALFPMFLLAARRRPGARSLVPEKGPGAGQVPVGGQVPGAGEGLVAAREGPPGQRQRALLGQLIMVAVGGGLVIGGATISVVGLTSVFVSTDLSFLGTDATSLQAANHRLLPFIAHDRAGFGGALMSAGVAVVLISVWGWRRGEAWVWWSLAAGSACGFGPTVIVHLAIGYTAAEHLAPVYLGIALTALALALSRPYLCAAGPAAGVGQQHAGHAERADAEEGVQPPEQGGVLP